MEGLSPLFPRIHTVIADAGHQSHKLARELMREAGWQLQIVKRRQRAFKVAGLTWIVERSFAWLGNFRRLLIRWESFFALYRSFFAVAVMLLCMRRATAFACPFPLGYAARGRGGGGVRGAIGSTTLEHERLRAEVAYLG